MTPEQQQRLLDRPFVRMLIIPMYSVRTELTGYFYDLRNYLAYDWLVTSGAVRNRYAKDPERFPTQVAFYELLDELLEPAWSIRPEGAVRGPSQQIYRLDDGFRAAVRERLGPRSVDHFRAFGGKVHAPHFLGFVQTIGSHAEFRERWADSAFWHQVLAQAALSPATRALGYERAGIAHLQLGQIPAARALFSALREFPEREVAALGNLGLIAEETGDPDGARALYLEVIRKDREGTARRWAEARLAELDGREP
jgi:tetratricopeptide (TPR) repeat protein